MKKIYYHPKMHMSIFAFSIEKMFNKPLQESQINLDNFDVNDFLFHRNNRF